MYLRPGTRCVQPPSAATFRMLAALCFFILLTTCLTFLDVTPNALANSSLTPRVAPEKPLHTQLWPGLREDLVIVKFREGSQVRLRSGDLVSLANQDISAAKTMMTNRDDCTVQRLFSRPETTLETERLRAQQQSGKQMADLNNYYQIRLLQPGRAAAETLIDALNTLPEIEIAYAEPIAEPAVLLAVDVENQTGIPSTAIDKNNRSDTPDFQSMQGYLDAAPTGINAAVAWAHDGGRGEDVKIIDIEMGWNWTHEDMRAPFFEGGVVMYDDHGIAVTGIISAVDNGFGVTGIANAAEIGGQSAVYFVTADAINVTVANLDPGDLYLTELHCPGPEATGMGQVGFIAIEWWQACFDAISAGTALGVTCCEAAGNGGVDFDDPIYEDRFDRSIRDSGAIIVGASEADELYAADFSNFGSRVDLSGWGREITTTGYGDLYGSYQAIWYTAEFGGTSGATPIVTGAVAAIQGIYKNLNGGEVLPGGTIAQLLKDTGTAMTSGGHIGPRPDLLQAIGAMLGGLSTITGTVTALDSGLPLAGADVQLLETGVRTVTEADGGYQMPVTPGQWTIETSTFGYAADQTLVTTTAGYTTGHDVVLTELDQRSLSGFVVDDDGLPLADVLVYLAGVPIDAVTTAANGAYLFDNIPVPFDGLVVAALPDRAPDLNEVVMLDADQVINLRLAIPESFEDGPAGYSGNGDWEWGIPTYPEDLNAHSGLYCWATSLHDNFYGYNMYLTSAQITVPDTGNPRLAFWHWHSVTGPFEGINVTCSRGSTFRLLTPIGGYTDPFIFRLDEQPGWTGSSGCWIPAVFDLSAYAGYTLRFRFNVGVMFAGTPGWYIDDVAVHGGPELTPVAQVPGMQTYLRAPWPTPSSDQVTIAFGLARPGPVSVDVYDMAGRKVRSLADGSLPAGEHQFHWNGCNQFGQPAGQGVYFVRLLVGGQQGPAGQTLTRRITLIR